MGGGGGGGPRDNYVTGGGGGFQCLFSGILLNEFNKIEIAS